MNSGRFQLGQEIPIFVHCQNTEIEKVPSSAPVATIYDADGTKVTTLSLPPVDRGVIDGLFVGRLLLDDRFDLGHYNVAINFVAAAVKHLAVDHFEVVDGGDVDGAVVSMTFYQRPHANFLVQRLSSGQRLIGRNPRST